MLRDIKQSFFCTFFPLDKLTSEFAKPLSSTVLDEQRIFKVCTKSFIGQGCGSSVKMWHVKGSGWYTEISDFENWSFILCFGNFWLLVKFHPPKFQSQITCEISSTQISVPKLLKNFTDMTGFGNGGKSINWENSGVQTSFLLGNMFTPRWLPLRESCPWDDAYPWGRAPKSFFEADMLATF